MAPPTLATPAVLALLANGEWHSGVALGQVLGVSRAAIWKQVGALRALGLTVAADRSLGYRLSAPLDLFRESAIRSALGPETRRAIESLEILDVTTSTNDWLTSRPPPTPGLLRVVAAEFQTGGRGRRGRRWLSPIGHGLCLSVSWSFETAPRDLPSLSLVTGVAVASALSSLDLDGVQLKWPNDVVAAGGKLGGILIEVAGEPGGPLRAVIGIGLNVRPVAAITAQLRSEGGAMPALAIDELRDGPPLSRNALVAALLDALHGSLRTFGESGFRTFLPEWRRRDCLTGQPVVVTRGPDSFAGIACGLADDGALLVDRDGAIVPVVAGDVTLRASP